MIQRARLALASLLAWAVLSMTATAETVPNLYVFGAEHCSYCDRASAFVHRLQTTDGRFKLHEHNITRSSDDAKLFVRIVASIGLPDPVVPMIIIGRNILLGYEDDETTGREIVSTLESCRTGDCPDVVRLFIDDQATASVSAAGGWSVHRRWASAGLAR